MGDWTRRKVTPRSVLSASNMGTGVRKPGKLLAGIIESWIGGFVAAGKYGLSGCDDGLKIGCSPIGADIGDVGVGDEVKAVLRGEIGDFDDAVGIEDGDSIGGGCRWRVCVVSRCVRVVRDRCGGNSRAVCGPWALKARGELADFVVFVGFDNGVEVAGFDLANGGGELVKGADESACGEVDDEDGEEDAGDDETDGDVTDSEKRFANLNGDLGQVVKVPERDLLEVAVGDLMFGKEARLVQLAASGKWSGGEVGNALEIVETDGEDFVAFIEFTREK